jgi:hypothetical protein
MYRILLPQHAYSTTVRCIQCPQCKDVIYSRCRHDMRWCSCGTCAIDGGFDYIKICCKDDTVFETLMEDVLHIDVPVTKRQLYDDWNYRFNQFGLLKQG